MNLKFNEETHTYWIDGQKVPSITQIIKAAKIGYDHRNTDPIHSIRGRAVHRAAELFAKGDLNAKTVDPRIRPYFLAFKQFLKDTRYKPLHSELRLGDEDHMFAGCIDSVGYLKRSLGIIEIKCTESVDQQALEAQLCAQEVLWQHNFPDKRLSFKYGLQLRASGIPNLITKFSQTPGSAFLAILDRVKVPA